MKIKFRGSGRNLSNNDDDESLEINWFEIKSDMKIPRKGELLFLNYQIKDEWCSGTFRVESVSWKITNREVSVEIYLK